MRTYSLAVWSLFSSVLLVAQHPGSAVFHAAPAARNPSPSERFALRGAPERWLPPVSEQEKALLVVRPGRTQTGLHRDVETGTVENGGSLERLPDGSTVWRMILRSPGAASLRLHFEDFHAGGGRLWLTELNQHEPRTFGPYTGAGLFGNGEFWGDVLFGEALLLEFQPVSTDSRALPFRLSESSHLCAAPITFEQASCD